MKTDYPMRRRVAELEKTHAERPNPDLDADLQRAFQIIDHLSFLQASGCDAVGDVYKALLEPDTKARRRKIRAIDRRIAKWLKANPNPRPIHSQPASPEEGSIFERPPLRLIQ